MGMMVVAGSLLLPLGACSRTSDGTIVVDKPAALPSFNLMPTKPLIPSWMWRKQTGTEQASASPNFPPPPKRRTAPKRKPRPPVVTTASGNLACRNVSEAGRVRMVCE